MVKLILRVPNNFDIELFGSLATSIVRDKVEEEHQRKDYDFDLGDFISPHPVANHLSDGYFFAEDFDPEKHYCSSVSELVYETDAPNTFYLEYEVDAGLLDMGYIEALELLQKITPQVDFWIENSGGGENTKNDWYEGAPLYELYRK